MDIKIEKTLEEKYFCAVATFNNTNVDNATVAYYSESLNLYFGTYSDTLKGKNVKINSQVAICIDNIQIHGMAHSDDVRNIAQKSHESCADLKVEL
jgi:hypothetical protein